MQSLMFLAHRIPYPPNKGDKIRSFNLLKHLARDYRIYLGAFIDDVDDWRHESVVRDLCADVCLVGINPRIRKLQSLSALLKGDALSLPYYFHQKLLDWVQTTLRTESISRILVYSSPMAQYVLDAGIHESSQRIHRVVDFVDVDAEKWRQYSHQHRWPMNWIYAREGKKLLQYDRKVAAECDVSVFVSDMEARLFCDLVPEAADRVTHVNNGVDTDYFSPHRAYTNPYKANEKVFVFTGAMDYWANVDAVKWFANDVFPVIQSEFPEARFYIVGARPTEEVRRLAKAESICVTGAVVDIRPYLFHAVSAVAPLRIARGLQNKVLEAMAMAKPVLATKAAIDGIRITPAFYPLISDEAMVLSHCGIKLLMQGDHKDIGGGGRKLVVEEYGWSHHLEQFEALLNDGVVAEATAAVGHGA